MFDDCWVNVYRTSESVGSDGLPSWEFEAKDLVADNGHGSSTVDVEDIFCGLALDDGERRRSKLVLALD